MIMAMGMIMTTMVTVVMVVMIAVNCSAVRGRGSLVRTWTLSRLFHYAVV